MSKTHEEVMDCSFVLPMPIWGPVRAVVRLCVGLGWTFGCYFILLAMSLAGLYDRPLAKRMKRSMARRWIKVLASILGLRITTYGHFPQKPYFLVNNHITWLDFLTMNSLLNARFVVMAELTTTPILGAFVRAMDAIPTHRLSEETPQVLAEMMATLKRGENLTMAPEGVISPGREVRRFRASLFKAAVDCQFPVHYASITYNTPENCPPACERVLFGPDPHYPWPDGVIPKDEFAGWGPQRTFLGHVLRLLALPWFECVVRFAPTPIRGTDPIQLANDLQRGVQYIFKPLQ